MAMSVLTLAGPAAAAFHAPAAAVPRRAAVQMASIEDLPGATVEVGNKVFDPLGLANMCPYGSMEFEWMRTSEIKHGRVCMAASVGWIINEAGIHFPGMLSQHPPIAFADLGTGLAAWDAVPIAGKAQILAAAGIIETASEMRKPHYLKGGMIKFEGPKADSRISELKNGRLAMIAVASFYSASVLPGSVPGLPAVWH
ncbi:hypothetical protein AB1Y20_018575 [Prymnesium parvum]|uniref:Uncharacterized protein n=1 Tax=Prymnesium parvum TaxID=97485 RepID=A0AB34JQB4_PRYPA|mmetsp:Transcript_14258/g.35577  ORF Transcript_14258/g.35577 Transcript_14258/m.35577 type:complete len:198 (+) Transcript_14258:52-645(+)|eukprot:CAMPEP_0182817314 /NCGR_PEP_ID=MMETSP0006_2-20121128/11405_1 /TAXON_ID=97485 /ORGANISM="Prymnesium parvum, Strain Texoma1" /LENGTH=197 /DNA_ID=CAMNT_0024943665 /DNA_START=27 /DNA_END=620 /DNA_ORIENTATION=-